MNVTLFQDRRLYASLLRCAGFIAFTPSTIAAQSNETTKVAQQRITAKGLVTDADGPVIGASVFEKSNKKNGTVTDLDGRFSLSVPEGATIVITYLGAQPHEVKAVAGHDLKVNLKSSSSTLNEVVVVGFGIQKKVNLTGAVDVIDDKQLAERPVSNATQALQGLTPGLDIRQTSGSLGARPSINVRGTGSIDQGTSDSPLVLIDGMEGDINSVNPQDIANISVLKDAAASSIYGSRAPFGVILITTKSGSGDGKVRINYNNNFRFGTPVNMNHTMNSVDFAAWMNDTFANDGKSAYFGAGDINDVSGGRFTRIQAYANATPVSNGVRRMADGTLIYAMPYYDENSNQWKGGYSNGIDNVDWFDVLYKKWSFSQEHNFSATGGSKKFNFYTSGSFFDQNSNLNLGKSNLQRYTLTAKINSELAKWLRMHLNMRFTREDYLRPADLTDNMYNLMGRQWPVLPLYDRNGNPYISDDTSVWNLASGGSDKTQTDNLYNQIGFEIEPIKNWVTHIDFNYRITSANRHWDKQKIYAYDRFGNPYERRKDSNVHEDLSKNNYYNFQAYTEYSHSFDKVHNFHIMAGWQVEDNKQLVFGLQRSGIIISSKPEVDMTTGMENGTAVTPSVNGARNEWATVGAFGRLNYDYKSRYLFEANLRTDGSSRFRANNRWKTFPSFSLGWNVAEESFFTPIRNVVDMLKIRASYGSLGNQNTDNWYQTYVTLSATPAGGSWLQNGAKPNVASAPGLVSESLTWETVETYNIGADLALFNSRLTGSFNYYIRNTKNMVGNAPELPAILGTGVPKTNNTDLRTQGWELTIGWQDRLSNGLSYGARMMLYDSKTKITRYPNNPTNSLSTYYVGQNIGDIWGYETIGIAKSQEEMDNHLASLPKGGQSAISGSAWGAGDIMYKDINNDGKIDNGKNTLDDHGDLKVIGNSKPRYQFSLDLNASWKGFDVRMYFQGVMKRDYWNGSIYMFGATGGGQWDVAAIQGVLDYYRDENSWSVEQGVNPVNKDAYLPRPRYSWMNLQTQTRYLQNAAYIRLKNFTLGYTLPTQLTSKWGVSQARFYFSAENLFTISGVRDQFDPETIETNYGNAYPLTKVLSLGLSITF